MSNTLTQLLVIMFGGALGAASRYMVSMKISERFGHNFPYGTIGVNIIGSFIMGFLAIVVVERFAPDPLVKLGVFVGFLGAFTTFSTFSMDALSMFEQDQQFRALAYMFSSVVLSVFAVWLGVLLGKALT